MSRYPACWLQRVLWPRPADYDGYLFQSFNHFPLFSSSINYLAATPLFIMYQVSFTAATLLLYKKKQLCGKVSLHINRIKHFDPQNENYCWCMIHSLNRCCFHEFKTNVNVSHIGSKDKMTRFGSNVTAGRLSVVASRAAVPPA